MQEDEDEFDKKYNKKGIIHKNGEAAVYSAVNNQTSEQFGFFFRNFNEYFLNSQSQYFFRVIIKYVEYKVGVELLNEVDILKKLKHPNIIQLKDLFKIKKNLTYRMIFEKCKVTSYLIKLEFIYN